MEHNEFILPPKEFMERFKELNPDLWHEWELKWAKERATARACTKVWADKNKEHLKDYKRSYEQRDYVKEAKRIRKQRSSVLIKDDVLTHYGKGKLACVRCGFSDVRALCIDHIYGGGTKHFKELGRYGNAFYYWLKNNGYPEGYQTLCFNCNMIKRFEAPIEPPAKVEQ
jgi:hypothetical protein